MPLHAPGLGDRLEPADQQLARILLEIGAGIGVAQHRQMLRQARDRLGDDVEVLGRMQRNRDAGGGAEPVRPHARGIDDELGLDVAGGRAHAGGAAGGDDDVRDLGILEDAGAAASRQPGQRLRGVDGIGLPILGQMHDADHIVRPHQRPQLAGLLRREQIDLQPEAARHRGAALQLFQPARIGGERQRSDLPEPGCVAAVFLERAVELGRVLREPGEVVGGAQLAHQPGGVPGRARRQLLALEQDDIGDAAQGEMIGDAAADDAAADDDDLRSRWKLGHDLRSLWHETVEITPARGSGPARTGSARAGSPTGR